MDLIFGFFLFEDQITGNEFESSLIFFVWCLSSVNMCATCFVVFGGVWRYVCMHSFLQPRSTANVLSVWSPVYLSTFLLFFICASTPPGNVFQSAAVSITAPLATNGTTSSLSPSHLTRRTTYITLPTVTPTRLPACNLFLPQSPSFVCIFSTIWREAKEIFGPQNWLSKSWFGVGGSKPPSPGPKKPLFMVLKPLAQKGYPGFYIPEQHFNGGSQRKHLAKKAFGKNVREEPRFLPREQWKILFWHWGVLVIGNMGRTKHFHLVFPFWRTRMSISGSDKTHLSLKRCCDLLIFLTAMSKPDLMKSLTTLAFPGFDAWPPFFVGPGNTGNT